MALGKRICCLELCNRVEHGWDEEQINEHMREILTDMGSANVMKVTSRVEG